MERLIEILLMLLVSIICSAERIVIQYPEYRSVYDTTLQVPAQVEWLLTREDVGNIRRNPSWKFKTDDEVKGIRATHEDYTNSGYHRGHLCPAADRSGETDLMQHTFRISNIAPQVASLNVGSWLQTEKWTRQKLRQSDSIRVVVVPIFLDRDTIHIGLNNIAVPHAYFKAAWLNRNDSVIGCWFIFNK